MSEHTHGESARKGIIFSAMQPTGRLHLGNLEGALRNWVKLQDQYEMFCGIVDLHALTTCFEDTQNLHEDSFQVAIDYLSAGIDPDKTAIVLQSRVPTQKHFSVPRCNQGASIVP